MILLNDTVFTKIGGDHMVNLIVQKYSKPLHVQIKDILKTRLSIMNMLSEVQFHQRMN